MHQQRLVYRGMTIEIDREIDPQNPRNDDNLGKMICFHGRYNLGDKHNLSLDEARTGESAGRIGDDEIISLPLYLYDHSGLAMQTRPFQCPWDSGKIGFIYVTKATLRKEFSRERITRSYVDRARDILAAEVAAYNAYLQGEVYNYTVTDKDGAHVTSCGGYLCADKKDDDYLMSEAKGAIDYAIEQRLASVAKSLEIDTFPQLAA